MEIIRFSGCFEKVPLQDRLAVLESLYNRPDNPYSVHELCDALGVARGPSTITSFAVQIEANIEDEQAQLMLKVKQVFDDSEQRYGAEKIRTVLAQSGIKASKKRVTAIMRELGLCSVRVDSKKLFKKRQQRTKENLLKREFSADHPNQIWVSDITQFKIKDYWVYLCIILDVYSRKVVEYRVSHNSSTHLVMATFRAAYQERGKPRGLTFHSDRGKQYTYKTFSDLLQECGVKQSFSASGKPLDNAVSEAFFATFKREEAYRREYTSEKHFCRSVEEYIRFYNEVRPHQTLNYKAPQAFEAACTVDL